VPPEYNNYFVAADYVDYWGIWWTDQTPFFSVSYNEIESEKSLYLHPVWTTRTPENENYLDEVKSIIEDAKDGEIEQSRLQRLREIKEEIKN